MCVTNTKGPKGTQQMEKPEGIFREGMAIISVQTNKPTRGQTYSNSPRVKETNIHPSKALAHSMSVRLQVLFFFFSIVQLHVVSHSIGSFHSFCLPDESDGVLKNQYSDKTHFEEFINPIFK